MMLNHFSLAAEDLPPQLTALREEVRHFLAGELAAGSYRREPAGWDRCDPAFSRKVGERGWIGMTWPRKYGGHERSSIERYVVAEELLAAGAPVRGHWLADRQVGPLLLSAGSEEQKRRYLPRMAAGECIFCDGLSEPDAGSDLASIRTKAVKVQGGWRVEGTKVWITFAHKAHMMNLLVRTSPRSEEDRHAGLSQFLVDMTWPGITVRPIINLAGDHDLNEVVFDGVFVPDDMVIGTAGNAWAQLTGEMAHERSGPERWINSYGLLVHLIDRAGPRPGQRDAEKIGRLVVHLWTLHEMSFAVAAMLGRGESPYVEAALVKDLGTHFDQEIPAVAREVVPAEARAAPPSEDRFNAMLDRALCYAPSFTVRGGAQEILRGIIARGLGLR